jgi:hypothetical protein
LLYRILRSPLAAILSGEICTAQNCQDELSRLIETLIQKNFERNLECLQLVRDES